MPSPLVDIVWNDKEWGPLALRTTQSNAARAIRLVTARIESAAVQGAPKRTDNMASAIFSTFRGNGFDTIGTVKSPAPYSLFVHEGTGIYGPSRKPITPKVKKALYWPGAPHPVKSVLGQRSQPFLKEAFDKEGPKLRQLVFG